MVATQFEIPTSTRAPCLRVKVYPCSATATIFCFPPDQLPILSTTLGPATKKHKFNSLHEAKLKMQKQAVQAYNICVQPK
jgi:hypothetical protein